MHKKSSRTASKLGHAAVAGAALCAAAMIAPPAAEASTQATVSSSGYSVNLRSGPGTSYSITGSVADGSGVTIVCTSYGESVSGTYGTSSLWDKLDNGSYIADTFVYTGQNGPVEPSCGDDPPPSGSDGGYPYADEPTCANNQCTPDPWGFYYRECTSFAAWKMNSLGATFYNNMNGGHFGNADHWDDNAKALGFVVDHTPAVNAIAQWNSNHVAVVKSVNGSSVTIEEYNYGYDGNYHTRTIDASSPDNYIHVVD